MQHKTHSVENKQYRELWPNECLWN